MKKHIRIIIVSAGMIALLAYAGFMPCGIRQIFAIPCPTCGMTRAFFSLFRGDIIAAFRFHPLFWLIPLCFALCIVLKNNTARRAVLITCCILLCIVYIIRMILYFPNTAPMELNRGAVIIKIAERIF